MKLKIIKPHKPQDDKLIFTEGINYFKTGKKSIWGKGDKFTLQFFKKIKINGAWLNLASGDGRYNLDLLKKVSSVVASDIDASALSKLWHNTPKKYQKKLGIKVFNITKKFPFKNNSFDGVFSAGTLHLFPKNILRKIFIEIDRVLKPNGKIILDFAANIKRTQPNGKLITFGNEPMYSLAEARTTLKNLFKSYRIKFYTSEVTEDYPKANPPYRFYCKFILLVADKRPILN